MQRRIFGCLLAALVSSAGGLAAEIPAGAVPLRLISAPALSPDGRSVVFEWAGDLWTASSEGGEAKRVVDDPARDGYPRFSPDGKRIVFSSERTGSLQVFSIPRDGGAAAQHTRHSEGNELQCLSPDGSRALVRGPRDRSGLFATRLMEIDLTADRRERRLFDATAHSAAWSPDGTRVLFCRGGGQLYRKGHHGSRASQIWLYRIKERSIEPVITGETEARSPLWLPDGKGFHFVSGEGGTANLWLKKDDSPPVPVTRYVGDGVISPDQSADGTTLVFRRGLEVFRFHPGRDAEPLAIHFWTRETLADAATGVRPITGTASADFTRDLKQVVFAAAGDLWWIPEPGKPPARITETTAAEDEVRFHPDGEWLYFLRDDGLEANLFRARFHNGMLREERQVTHGTRTKSRFRPSPDGSKIAWVEGTGDVFTARPDGSEPRRVFECWDMPTWDWSPDGRWLAIAAEDRDSNRDIWLVAADGGREPVNLTRHPGFEGSPKWSPDGRWLVFSARRDASGETALWRIDFGKGGPADAHMADDMAEKISTKGIEPARAIWAADSKSLWFQSRVASSKKLYAVGVDGRGLRTVTERRGIPIRMTTGGELLWRVDRTPEVFTESGTTVFPISGTAARPREEVLRLGFRRIWRTLGERFFDPNMNGLDWNSVRLKYEAAAAGARDSRQFDRVVSQLMGELNASHLTFLRRPWPGEKAKTGRGEKTAHPGLEFADDDGRSDAPLRIARVIPGSPVAMLVEPPVAGDCIVRIAGQEVSHDTPLHGFFNDAANRVLPVVLRSADGRERVIELRCVSYARIRALDRKQREATAMARVAAADPKTAYLLVPNMNRETLADVELAVHRISQTAERLILDLRNNGGGREADRLLNLFCQPVHSTTIPRGGPAGYPLDRRPAPAWNGPMVVLCNEDTFSNAEIFCHAVKHAGRAPLVGTTTAGGVISAVKSTIPDVGELQVPFRGWFHAGTGANLDRGGARPDHPVDLTPADEDAGRDPQLEKALEVLKR